MNSELTNKLFKEYPKLTVKLTCLDVGDGWYDLMNHLFDELKDFPIQMRQCKSKFGVLNAYYDIVGTISESSLVKINNVIRECETISVTMCEDCGRKAGKRNCQGWIHTFCEEHYQEWLNSHSASR